jgi:hypothetical protein
LLLEEENKKQTLKINTLLDNNQELLGNNRELLDKANANEREFKKIVSQNETLSDKLDAANDKKVVPTGKKGDVNKLLIVKNRSDNKNDFKYTAFRVQHKNMKIAFKSHMEKFPRMNVILNIKESPNAVNLWMRVKETLEDTKFSKCKGRNFNLKTNYTEQQLKRDIKKIHDELFDDGSDSDNNNSDNNNSDNDNSD